MTKRASYENSVVRNSHHRYSQNMSAISQYALAAMNAIVTAWPEGVPYDSNAISKESFSLAESMVIAEKDNEQRATATYKKQLEQERLANDDTA